MAAPGAEHDAQYVAVIVQAYRQGLFPMADPDGTIGWYAPDPRAVIELGPGGFHVSRSLARRVRSGRFAITTDESFEAVVDGCAEARPGREETWIDEQIHRAACAMHRAGKAHSVEAWLERDGQRTLVGGVYGMAIGGAFFAESMFSRPEFGGTDASKVALVHLVEHLRARGFGLLDVQFTNPFIDQFGVVEIPRDEFLVRLAEQCDRTPAWGSLAGGPEDGRGPAGVR